MIGRTLGPYRVVEKMGAGGMGEVYRARDTRLGRDVAIKVLPAALAGDEGRLRRFEIEARAVGALNHPNLLVLFDVGSQEGAPYVVTELLEGESLRERLVAGSLPARRAIDVAVQTARGLDAAHEKGIIHRDLKPENLFLTSDGRVKILDFGLAKLMAPAEEGAGPLGGQTLATVSEVGQVLGTVGYMAPEQIQGQAIAPATDVFALGVVLYEMLSGRRAFQGDTAVDVLHAILRQDPPELPAASGVPPALDRIMRRCLEKRPEDRFHSAHDLAFALEALSGSVSVTSPPPIDVPGARRRWRRPSTVVASLLAAAAATAATAAVMSWRKPPEPQPPRFTQVTLRRQGIWQARFGPDGKTVVYGAAYQEKDVELFATRIGSPDARSLGIQRADLFSVSPTGELAIRLEAVPFAAGTLASVPLEGGTPREILTDVSGADWSPDGKALAVILTANGRQRLEFPIGTLLAEADAMFGLAFSPTGEHIGVLVREGPRLYIAIVSPGQPGVLHKVGLVAEGVPYDLTGFCWAGDGQAIRYMMADRASQLRSLSLDGQDHWLMTLPGNWVLQDCREDGAVLVERVSTTGEISGVLQGQTEERDLSWFDLSAVADLSRDGATLLFSEGAGPFSAYLRRTDGTPAVRLGDGWPVALSPDGQWALALGRGDKGIDHILLPTGAGQARRLPIGTLVRRPPPETFWLPDGRRFIFGAAAPGGQARCYIQSVEGGDPRPITAEGMARCRFPSPDGRFVFTGQNALFDLEGGTTRTVPGLTAEDEPIGWNEDGSEAFVAVRPSNATAHVYRVNVSSGRRTHLRDVHAAGPTGGASGGLQTIRVSADGRTMVYTVARYFSELVLIEGLR